jgi:hypothetical protein
VTSPEPTSSAAPAEQVTPTGEAAPAEQVVAAGEAAPAEQLAAAGSVGKPSGLRNPEAAVRGLGSGTLFLEAIVLLLAIQPIRVLGGHLGGWGIGAVVALAVLCVLVGGVMKRRWAWGAGTVLQVLLLAGGLLHWSLAALGLIFGAAWAYASYVRRSILG